MRGASCLIVAKFCCIVLRITLSQTEVVYLKFTASMASDFIKLANGKTPVVKTAQNLSVLYEFIKFILCVEFRFYSVFYTIEFKTNFIRVQQQSRRSGR